MNIVTKTIFTQEVCPYLTCAQYEHAHTCMQSGSTFFVFIPNNALGKMGKRPRIGQEKTEIFEKSKDYELNKVLNHVLIGRVGRGKLYLFSGGSIRELTDEVFTRAKAKHAIRIVLGVTERDEHLDCLMEKRMLENDIENYRKDREHNCTYVRDDRTTKRYKFHKAIRHDCNGQSYSSLGNYIHDVRNGYRAVTCRSSF